MTDFEKLMDLVQTVAIEAKRDPEAAHAAEDKLLVTALEMIATGSYEISMMPLIAQTALSTQKIDFHRHWA